jgi:hypothetical protein
MVETRPLCKRELAKTALAATFDALVRPVGRRRKNRSALGLSLESPPLLASPLLPPAAGVDSPSFSAPPHLVSSLAASPFPALSLSSAFSGCAVEALPILQQNLLSRAV